MVHGQTARICNPMQNYVSKGGQRYGPIQSTELESMDITCRPILERLWSFVMRKACAEVRIISDPKRDIGLQIMSYFHYRGGVNIVTCENLGDAKKILSQ